MKVVLVAVLSVVATLLAVPVIKTQVSPTVSSLAENPAAKETKLEVLPNLLEVEQPKVTTVKSVLTLEAKNTVVFRGVVSGDSVAKAMREINKLSKDLSKKEPIYLVLDTPGGSVFDGMDFIDYLEGIPQEVKTVTLFAASMGFQIAENNPGERLIARNGILMAHRASGGVQGQFNGELESEYKMVKRKIDYLDVNVAKRLGLTYDDYQKKINAEYWIHGFDAVDQKVADKMVLVQCGSTLTGTQDMKVRTLFGDATIKFDACPLMRDPISASFDDIKPNAKQYVQSIFNLMFTDRNEFVNQIIKTNTFYKIFQ